MQVDLLPASTGQRHFCLNRKTTSDAGQFHGGATVRKTVQKSEIYCSSPCRSKDVLVLTLASPLTSKNTVTVKRRRCRSGMLTAAGDLSVREVNTSTGQNDFELFDFDAGCFVSGPF